MSVPSFFCDKICYVQRSSQVGHYVVPLAELVGTINILAVSFDLKYFSMGACHLTVHKQASKHVMDTQVNATKNWSVSRSN